MSNFNFAVRARFRWVVPSVIAVAVITSLIPRGVSAGEGVASAVASASATHSQTRVIKVANSNEGQKLEDFCIASDGRILALLGPVDPNDPDSVEEGEQGNSTLGAISRLLTAKKKSSPRFESAVHVYDIEGKLAEKWSVGFSGQAINVAPDGSILVGGNGRVARFDSGGTKLTEAESPQMTYIDKNPDEMRERAKDQLQSDKDMYAENLKQFQEQLDQVKNSKKNEKKTKQSKKSDDEDDIAPQGQMNEQNLKAYVDLYKRQLDRLEKKTIEEALQEVTSRAKRINAIAGSENEVFVTCPAMAGYGYGVWRTDEKFQNAKEIVKSLSGCCGQMDVQCHNGELYVCENSRHRVIRFNREGKEIAKFGKRDREGEGENFGSCCNPMNLCFNKTGDLYVSESNGVVKHFTPDGEYKGIVGIAKVQPGCKNSCVGVTSDDSRLFYIDIHKAQIIILARNDIAAAGVGQ